MHSCSLVYTVAGEEEAAAGKGSNMLHNAFTVVIAHLTLKVTLRRNHIYGVCLVRLSQFLPNMTEEDRQQWLITMKKIKMSVDARHELINVLY